MAGLLLSRVTARRAGLDAEAVWDAALATVLAGLVFLRVVGPRDLGLVLTGVFGLGYLRWKRLPVLGFLDAMAPCAALVWGFMSLGGYVDGTREGMPTGCFLRGRGGTHPVELYGVAAGMGICGLLLVAGRLRSGWVFAWGLGLGGAGVFLLDFLRLPRSGDGAAMLDPVEWLGLGMMVVGGAVWIALPGGREG